MINSVASGRWQWPVAVNTVYCRCYCYLFILTLGTVQAQPDDAPLPSINVAHVYNPDAPLLLDAEVAVQNGEEATVFLRVINRLQQEAPQLYYEVRAGYEEAISASDTLSQEHLIKTEGNQYYFRFAMPLSEESDYLFVYAQASGNNPAAESYRFDIALNTEYNFPLTDLLLMRPDEDIPIFQDYLPTEAPVRLVSYYGGDSTAYIYYYSHNFEPNPPPMSSGGDTQRNLEIDSLFSVPLGETLSFDGEGLYFTQLDTTSLYGMSFRIEDQYYPRVARIETVIPPLRYISTSDEMDNLLTAENPKQNLDEYWVQMTRSQERAKGIIRDYFRQVARANRLFTSYKEGWKTGQGMIYVLYGPPDAVYRDNQQEVWTYDEDRNLVDLSFTFAKVKNIFTHEYYNLVRDEDYKRFWFRNVDLWRKGRKEF